MTRYAERRDAVEKELVIISEQMGGAWHQGPPLDGFIFVGRLGPGGIPVEIKDPAREGLVHEYTPQQKRFFAWCELRNIRWFIWRTVDDVIRDLGGRRAA